MCDKGEGYVLFCDEAIGPVMALKKRLAQAERDRDLFAERWATANKHGEALIAERDAALARVGTLEWELKNRDGGVVERLRAERDTYKQGEADLQARYERTFNDMQAALAKAEAAEKKERENGLDAQEYKHHLITAQTDHAHLRTRIEALAEQWTRDGHHHKHVYIDMLRALLQPPKPSMDRLTEEHIQSLEHAGITPDFATKLRKMLQGK